MKTELQRYEDNFDKVVKYYFDEKNQVKLSDDLLNQLERWKFVRMIYSSWKIYNRREVVNAVIKEFDVNEATAYRDVANAQRLFVRLEEVNREFERIIQIEKIKKTRDKCEAKGDFRTVAVCDTNLIKIGGYDKELEPPKVIVNIINQLTYDPSLVDAEPIADLEKTIKSFLVKKKKQLDEEFAEDANVIEEELKNVSK
ncbi:MAG: hypothetical protein WBP45_11045 [Daejeonella sp.]